MQLTKNSDTLPDGSLTPPPNTVVEVLCTCCGVEERVLLDEAAPAFLIVFPRSQPPTLFREVIVVRVLWLIENVVAD